MSKIIGWEEPPGPGRSHDETIAELKERPNEWALIEQGMEAGKVNALRGHFRRADCKVKQIHVSGDTLAESTYDVYAKYVDPADATTE